MNQMWPLLVLFQCWESACVLAALVEWAEWFFVMWGQLQPVRLKLHQWLGKLSFSEPLGLLNQLCEMPLSGAFPAKRHVCTGAHTLQIFLDPGGTFRQINMLICYVSSLNEWGLISRKKRKLFRKWLCGWKEELLLWKSIAAIQAEFSPRALALKYVQFNSEQ